jgi:O-antigen/teichoic acid export membrane protein
MNIPKIVQYASSNMQKIVQYAMLAIVIAMVVFSCSLTFLVANVEYVDKSQFGIGVLFISIQILLVTCLALLYIYWRYTREEV